MGTNVKKYTDRELLERVKQLPSFNGYPFGYWIIGVQSNEDQVNVMDDKFYVYNHREFVGTMTGTTNSGSYGLLNWKSWSSKGLAQIKPNEWYYEVWKRGLHKGKIEALRQVGSFTVLRDNNNNLKSGDVREWSEEKYKGLNFHPNTYNLNSTVKRWTIGRWSVGCQVVNDIPAYKRFLAITKPQELFTYVLLKEF